MDPIELFAKYHIVGLRHTKNGYIRQIKHVQWGWMTPEDYYRLQKIHDALPIIGKVIEGGYRLKAALWGIDISFGVLASGTEVPLAIGFIAGAFVLSTLDKAAGHPELAALDIAALALPFGEIYLIWRGAVAFGPDLSGVTPPTGEPGTPEYQASALQSLQELARLTARGLGWFPF